MSEAIRPEDVVLSDPEILGGTPCFAGTRVPVDILFEYIQYGYTVEYFLSEFPSVSREKADAVLQLARDLMPREARRAG